MLIESYVLNQSQKIFLFKLSVRNFMSILGIFSICLYSLLLSNKANSWSTRNPGCRYRTAEKKGKESIAVTGPRETQV